MFFVSAGCTGVHGKNPLDIVETRGIPWFSTVGGIICRIDEAYVGLYRENVVVHGCVDPDGFGCCVQIPGMSFITLMQRTVPEAIRKQLFTSLITVAMSVGPPRAELHRLVSFPFTTVEAEMFVEYLLEAAREDEFARDVLLMWNIQTARFTEARETMLGEGQGSEKRRVIREGLEKAKVSI
jgi:hypothetical protein